MKNSSEGAYKRKRKGKKATVRSRERESPVDRAIPRGHGAARFVAVRRRAWQSKSGWTEASSAPLFDAHISHFARSLNSALPNSIETTRAVLPALSSFAFPSRHCCSKPNGLFSSASLASQEQASSRWISPVFWLLLLHVRRSPLLVLKRTYVSTDACN